MKAARVGLCELGLLEVCLRYEYLLLQARDLALKQAALDSPGCALKVKGLAQKCAITAPGLVRGIEGWREQRRSRGRSGAIGAAVDKGEGGRLCHGVGREGRVLGREGTGGDDTLALGDGHGVVRGRFEGNRRRSRTRSEQRRRRRRGSAHSVGAHGGLMEAWRWGERRVRAPGAWTMRLPLAGMERKSVSERVVVGCGCVGCRCPEIRRELRRRRGSGKGDAGHRPVPADA